MIYLTRRERFCSAHRLFNKDWTEEKNKEFFGDCSNPNWHGHNYELFVIVKGEVNKETGIIMNLKDLSKLLKEKIINKLDHKNINLEVDFMKNEIASTENLVIKIWEEIEKNLNFENVKLHSVKIIETENNYFEYFGK